MEGTTFERAWSALGKFVFEFADVAEALRDLVLEYAGGAFEVNKVLLDSAVVSRLVSYLKKLAQLREQDLPEGIVASLQQFTLISTARNVLLHNGPTIGSEAIIVSTFSTRGVAKGATYTFSYDDLYGMAYDLQKIKWIIIRAFNPVDGVDREPTWLYKPTQPRSNHPRRDDIDRSFRHPHAPFPE